MEWYNILLISIASLLVLYVVFCALLGYKIFKYIAYPKCRNLEEIIEYETNGSKKFTKEEYDNEIKFEDFDFKSTLGYTLKASYQKPMKDVTFNDGKKRVAIMVHGWTSNRYSMFAYGKIYSLLGFHVFYYDHRNHFMSDKVPTSMGYYESIDLETFVNIVKERMGDNIIIGTHGESMGAATVMLHISKYKNLDFAVEDCGYSNLDDLFKFQCLKVNHVPSFPTLIFTKIFFKKQFGVSFKDVRPADNLDKCDNIPMYFVHGLKDRFVPTNMVYDCYNNKKGFKRIDTYEDAIHARSITTYRKEYYANLEEFLKEANIID